MQNLLVEKYLELIYSELVVRYTLTRIKVLGGIISFHVQGEGVHCHFRKKTSVGKYSEKKKTVLVHSELPLHFSFPSSPCIPLGLTSLPTYLCAPNQPSSLP